MASDMNKEEALEMLKSGDGIETNQFEILQIVANEVNMDPSSLVAHELVLRAMENRVCFTSTESVLYSLVREIGLFPYLDCEALSLKETIAYEYHRPENLDDIIFHQEQLPIYRKLLDGKNIVLSAPTSFGKSKIIDAVIADQKFANIVIVVPTLALIDETRRRITEQFSSLYNIVAHPSQMPAEGRNVFIFTPERVVAYKDNFPQINFFVIDEFYKIGGQNEEDHRVIALNEAFYFLYKKHKAQFYMLGPNIRAITDGANKRFNFEFISTDFNTVITETVIVHVANSKERYQKLISICRDIVKPTLIYCRSPKQVYEVAEQLVEGGISFKNSLCDDAADWLAKEFHPDWILPNALRVGIGLHYGPLPRSIAQEMVRCFNDERIRFLVCTSTLIEGVNTKAKNVLIFENKIARQKLDYFTFNNIKGRSGRMFTHFVGRVFCFDDEPQQELPFVDFPLHTQDDDTSESLLIQMDPEDLNSDAKQRIEDRIDDSPLPIDLLKDNHGIEPILQVAVYTEIISDITRYHDLLAWGGLPEYDQLKTCCEIIWKNWIQRGKYGVYTASHLTYKIWGLKKKESIAERILHELSGDYAAKTVNEGVERILSFDRNWAGFEFPKYLMALDRIQRFVFESRRMKAGDYSFLAKNVESLFRPEICIALDEFGIPIPLSEKCSFLTNASDLLDALERLKKRDIESLKLHPYEKELLYHTREGAG
jgi:hypothetical protein